jgi:pyrrolidone-carboxylate peptidase
MPLAALTMSALLLLLSSLAIGAAAAAGEPVILLTAFEPFAGRGVNGSATVANRLAGTVIGGARVVVLVLPVRWGEPERRLPDTVTRLKPVLLLGLGEGQPGRGVVVERLGANLARHLPDASGALPPGELLDPQAPSHRPARFQLDAAWFPAGAVSVQESHDAGGYLCNELLFTALAQPVAVCGFVHLAPQGDQPDEAYATPLVPVIRALIAHNVTP